MSASNNKAPSRLLGSEGWDTRVDAQLLRASDTWEDSPEFRSHGHAMRRLFTDLTIDAVLCLDKRPSVCVKDGRELSSVEVEVLRRKLWNLGATTLLVVETPYAVDVFSTIAKPLRTDEEGSEARLTSETVADLESAALALHLEKLIRRVETGAIYRQHQPLFDSKSSVNPNLLSNLREARNLICPTKSKEGYRRAHAFIGRFLFSCYLLDRGIVGPRYLKKANLPDANDMLELLDSASTRGPETLDALFKVLQRDFNGSLFGDSVDDYSINDAELIYLRRFLSGEDLRTGQLSFFKLYDFSFIPVELISSIYEEFVGAEAEAEVEAGQSRRHAHGLRTQGAYYTPPRLAELTIDVATEGWDTLLDKRCLDPACGSGLFLVILFIRMAEEWRRRNPEATTRDRYEALMSLLSENLQGVDTHPTACLVTCFSLYLAFLDQMEPKEIFELREALEQDTHQKLLPRILWEREKNRPRPPHFATVRELDFFAMPALAGFHLVIGNPPWVSRKSALSVEQWLFSKHHNPYLRDIPEPVQRQTLFPAGELACAFMWKAGLHVLPQGRVCQVLPSRVFLSNNTGRFQAAWLRHHRIETVWLLADWSFVLFPTADCPCFISRYHPKRDDEELATFEFITPKVELLDPREALIPVLPEDQKTLSESDIVSAARNKEAAAAWKRQHWGTPRDGRLIDRLMRMPRLKGLAKAPPRDPSSVPGNRKRYWFKGQGFRRATESTEKPEKVFWKETDPFLAADTPVLDLILLRKDCPPIGDRYEGEGLDRKRNSLIYEAPLLLINKACTKFLASNFNVLFTDDFLSICAPKHEEDELLFLGAVLSSPLTQYLLFHTTANIGIERDIARVKEILELPFPLPEDMRDPTHSEFILRSCAQRLRSLRDELQEPRNLLRSEYLVSEAQEELYHFVCDYFEICEWERHLIEDTVNVFRPSSTPGSLDSENLLTAKSSTSANRKEYAETLIQTFRGSTRTKKHLWAEGAVASELNLALITLGIADRARRYAESPAEDRVKKVIDNIRIAAAHDRTSTFHRLRGFALYEQDRVHILKPLNRRHWTATAALNDADEILTRMMEEGGWHV
jgi:Eco57I restriction-modification methylase